MQMKATMERELEYWPPGAVQSLPIRVRIGVPVPHPRYDWESTLTIEGFPEEPHYSKAMHGADPINAISYALAIAPLHLRLMGQRGGRLTWNGSEVLRFPSMFSEPTQDWQLTPPEGGEPRRLGMRVGLPERIEDQWSVLVTCTDCKTWATVETRVHADTWPEVLGRAAAAVPLLLQQYADKLGGGALEELHRSPKSGSSDGDP